MKVKLSTLSNGLRVITTEMPNLISATCKVLVNTGSRNEKEFEKGVTHALEHLRFKSTKNRSTFDIAKELEMLGGYTNAYTSKETTVYYASGLSESIPKFIEILGDTMSNTLFEDKDVRTESGVILQEIAMYADNVSDISADAYYDAAFNGQPIAHPILGTKEFVANMKREDFLRYEDEHYFAKNMVLSIAGNVNHDEICELAEKHLGHIKSDNPNREIRSKTIFQNKEKIIVNDFEQICLNVGFHSSLFQNDLETGKIAHALAGTALGGGMCSPLWQEIREKRALVYSTYSYSDELSDLNSMIIGAGTTPDNFEELLQTMSNIANNFNSLVTNDDIFRAKNAQLVQLSALVENANRITSHFGYLLLEGRALEMPEITIQKVKDFDEKNIRDLFDDFKNLNIAVGAAGPVPFDNVIDKIKN